MYHVTREKPYESRSDLALGIRAEAEPGPNIRKVMSKSVHSNRVSSAGVLNGIRTSDEEFVGTYKAEFDGEHLYAELRRETPQD